MKTKLSRSEEHSLFGETPVATHTDPFSQKENFYVQWEVQLWIFRVFRQIVIKFEYISYVFSVNSGKPKIQSTSSSQQNLNL